MSRRITVTECPSCGAPVDAQQVAGEDVPACAFCHAALPFVEDRPQVPVVFSSEPLVVNSAGRAIRWVVWSSIIGGVLVPVVVVVAVLASHHSSTPATQNLGTSFNTGTGAPTTTAPPLVPVTTAPTGNTGGGNTGSTTANEVDKPGGPVAVGYDLRIPGTHARIDFKITGAQVTFTAQCTAGGRNVKFSVKMRDAQIVVPADSTAWYPSADPSSSSSFQGSGVWPDACGHHGTFVVVDDQFEANLDNNTGPGIDGKTLDARWHWSGTGSDGSWSDPATTKI